MNALRIVVAALLAAGLGACQGPPDGPVEVPQLPPNEVATVEQLDVAVLPARGAIVSSVSRFRRGTTGDRLAWTLQGWTGIEQEQLLAAGNGEQGEAWPLNHAVVVDTSEVAWYVDGSGQAQRWCRRDGAQTRCAGLPRPRDGSPNRASVADDGRALLVGWHADGAWAARGTGAGPGAAQPLALGSAARELWALTPAGADYVIARSGGQLEILAFRGGAWSAPAPLGELRDPAPESLVLAQQRGSGGATWAAWCAPAGLVLHRFDANGAAAAVAPPAPGCGSRGEATRLAAADNGDLLAAWSQLPDGSRPGGWVTSRWIAAEGRWTAAEPLDASPTAITAPVLAADANGRFAAMFLRDSRAWVRVYRPGEGWLPVVEIGPASAGTPYDIAASADGRIVAGWSVPSAIDGGSRLALRELDMGSALVPLSVVVEGGGRVSSRPSGLACPGTCTASFVPGSTVIAIAAPDPGYSFRGWSGGALCSGIAEESSWTMPAARAVCTARFERDATTTLSLAVQGNGRVGADPVGPAYRPGTAVTLIATPGPGQRLAGWSGDADCSDGRLTMDADRSCTAHFEADPAQVALSVTQDAGGRITSSPPGLACVQSSCTAYFAAGATVVLYAEPPAGRLATWSGACVAGSGNAATLVLAAAASCTVGYPLPGVAGWQDLGAAPPPMAGSLVGRPAIATDAQGTPTVAYTSQQAELRELYVQRLEAGAWRLVGTGPINDLLVSANEPSLALDAAGQPVVAFGDARGRVQVRRWTGGTWEHLADDLSTVPGATTSAPQLAIAGDQAVVALNEAQGSRWRIALMRGSLATGTWSGALLPGVQLDNDASLRLSLDAAGLASLAYVTGGGISGERTPRVLREGPGGWAPACSGDPGPAAGTSYANTIIGFGLQHAADGSLLLVRSLGDFLGVQAWRCDGTAWAAWGDRSGVLASVNNSSAFLKSMATGSAGTPTVAVVVSTGYALGLRLHAFVAGPTGFVEVSSPLTVTAPPAGAALAVAPAAAGSPVAAYGIESGASARLQVARFYP